MHVSCEKLCQKYIRPKAHRFRHVGHGLGLAVAHPVAHTVAEVCPDKISPYQYQYAVADNYFGSLFDFDASETDDGCYCGP